MFIHAHWSCTTSSGTTGIYVHERVTWTIYITRITRLNSLEIKSPLLLLDQWNQVHWWIMTVDGRLAWENCKHCSVVQLYCILYCQQRQTVHRVEHGAVSRKKKLFLSPESYRIMIVLEFGLKIALDSILMNPCPAKKRNKIKIFTLSPSPYFIS